MPMTSQRKMLSLVAVRNWVAKSPKKPDEASEPRVRSPAVSGMFDEFIEVNDAAGQGNSALAEIRRQYSLSKLRCCAPSKEARVLCGHGAQSCNKLSTARDESWSCRES